MSAQRRVEDLLDRYGLLLVHDARFPSATACIAGEPIRGSWWGHAQGKLIFETLTRMEDTVAWVKLVLGKETLVHRRLWPALVAAAECGADWQRRGLKPEAARLLGRVRRGGRVAVDRARATAATELERRLLARSTSEHAVSGRHVRFLESWGAWAKTQGIAAADRPAVADALAALTVPVREWTGGRAPTGMLPWLPRR